MVKKLVLVLCDVSAGVGKAQYDLLQEYFRTDPYVDWAFSWPTTIEEAKSFFDAPAPGVTHVLIASVMNLGTDKVAKLVRWLRSSVKAEERRQRFAGPIIVASADEDCQAAVVKAGADYAIPKSAIPCLLFHIHTS